MVLFGIHVLDDSERDIADLIADENLIFWWKLWSQIGEHSSDCDEKGHLKLTENYTKKWEAYI